MRSGNVLPGFILQQLMHSSLANAVLQRQRAYSDVAGSVTFPNSAYLNFFELSQAAPLTPRKALRVCTTTMSFAANESFRVCTAAVAVASRGTLRLGVSAVPQALSLPAFRYTVGAIIGTRPEKQVFTILAFRSIAGMTDVESARLRSVLERIGNAMSEVAIALQVKAGILSTRLGSPKPTFIRAGNDHFGPEALNVLFRKFGNWFILVRHADYTSHVIGMLEAGVLLALTALSFYNTPSSNSIAEAV